MLEWQLNINYYKRRQINFCCSQAVSGLIADARQVVEIARKECVNYRTQYGVNIPLNYLNDRVSMYMHAYTLYSAVRPFGASAIIGSYDEDGPSMFMLDPSGVSYVSFKLWFSRICITVFLVN